MVIKQINRCVRIFDMNTGTILKTLPGRGQVDQQFVRMAMSPDNKYVAAVGDYFTVTIWDINTGQVVKYLNLGVRILILSALVRIVNLIIVERNNDIRIYNMSDWSFRTLINPPLEPYDIAITKNEKYVALLSYNGSNGIASLWDYQSGVFKYDIPNSSLAGQPSFDPTGRNCLSYSNNKFIVWDVESNSLVKSISNFGYPVFMGGALMKICHYILVLIILPLNYGMLNGEKIGRFYESSNFAEIKFSPDNQRVFTREFSHSYYLWDIVHRWVQNIN
ncbi:MAG: hypothetical protein MZV64_08590 [Ignavibacteriales bacterium]|nr:hypothetical protein [Ignavibacteriales bacterium]